MGNVTQANLVDELFVELNALGLTKRTLKDVLDAYEDKIVAHVADGDRVSLAGFVKFEPATTNARESRNPRTGEAVHVPAKNVVRVRPLKRFKDALNEG